MLADAVPSIAYTGVTVERRRVVVTVRGRDVVGVRAGITRYACATFGDVGPLVVRESGRARIASSGRFAFTAGEDAQRVTVTGVVRAHARRVTGTLRVRGSIATGQRCASAALRFTATAR